MSFFITETPLSLAVGIKKNSSKMLITLVNGGAIVDFRSKTDGSTAMHRAVTKNSIEGKVMEVKSLTLILLPFNSKYLTKLTIPHDYKHHMIQ